MRYKQGRSDRDIGTTLRIPNDDTGLAFLAQLRQYSVRGVRIRVRSRGPRVMWAPILNRSKRAVRQDLPRKFAQYFAVYVDKTTPKQKRMAEQRAEEFWRLWEQVKRVPELERQMEALAKEVRSRKLFELPAIEGRARRKFRFDA